MSELVKILPYDKEDKIRAAKKVVLINSFTYKFQEGGFMGAYLKSSNTSENLFKDPELFKQPDFNKTSQNTFNKAQLNLNNLPQIPKVKGVQQTPSINTLNAADIGNNFTTIPKNQINNVKSFDTEGIKPPTNTELNKSQAVLKRRADNSNKDNSGNGKSSSVLGVVSSGVGGITAGINSLVDDGRADKYTTGEAAAAIGGDMVNMAATGAMTAGVPGAIVGGAIGLITGGLKAFKGNKEADKERKRLNRVSQNKSEGELRSTRAKEASNRAQNTPAILGFDYIKNNYGYQSNRTGGILTSELMIIKSKARQIKSFQSGGTLTDDVNIIPNGVLHEEENKLGDKGMPVVKCDLEKKVCEKKYEIEKDEMIFTLDSSKKIEELANGKKFKELGEYVKEQVLNNTHSFTSKYKKLNKLN